MLVIRDKQIKALEDAAARNFENELVQHIKEFAPKHSEVIQDKGVRGVVRLGIERAETYGFTKRGPTRFYVELMFMFGSDFDTDFQLPWAEEILTNDIIKNEMERSDFLHEKMLEYLKQVARDKNEEYSLKALRRLKKARMEDYRVAGGDFDKQAIVGLRDIYPQKCEYLGVELLQTLVKRAKVLAKEHSITSEKGKALFVALIFVLGHGFANDSLFPWVKTTLEDESIVGPNERAERLERKMKIYLDRALEYLEQSKK